MTTLDLDALERGLEGVTKGPWQTHLVDDTTIVSPDGTVVATTCDSAETEREDGYNIEYERMERDAAHIARCDPDTIRELIRLARLGLEAERWQPIEWEGRREYIPLPAGWEVQTKGDGSSYRLLDRKTGERHAFMLSDGELIHAFFTRFARELHAATAPAPPKTGGE